MNWTPAPDALIHGRELAAVAPLLSGGACGAVRVTDLIECERALVAAALADVRRPTVDRSGAWAYPGDVARVLLQLDAMAAG